MYVVIHLTLLYTANHKLKDFLSYRNLEIVCRPEIYILYVVFSPTLFTANTGIHHRKHITTDSYYN